MAEDDHGPVSGFGCLRRQRRSNKVHISASLGNQIPQTSVSIEEIYTSAKISSATFTRSEASINTTSTITQKDIQSEQDVRPSNSNYYLPIASHPNNPNIADTESISSDHLRSNEDQADEAETNPITSAPDEAKQSPSTSIAGTHHEESVSDELGIEPPELLIRPKLFFPSRGPLLGSEEMEKYLPKRQANVQITTWNMASLPLPSETELSKLFVKDGNELIGKVDIHVVGVQECWQDYEAWELLLQTCLGNGYALFDSLNLGSLHLSVFIRRDLLWFTTEPVEFTQSVRAGRLFKTKGATGISFGFFGSRLLFINCHLSAGTQGRFASQRVEEIRKILAATEKNNEHYDVIFLFGDLNFRIYGLKYETIIESLKENNICSLLEKDQLSYIFRRKDTLPAFLEPFLEAAAITFMPTYKYDIGTDTFDTSTKQRAPAYTDRIIYRSRILPNGNANAFCVAYDGIFDMKVSDHRPVYGVFSIELKPGFDTLQISGARFKRDLYIKAIQNEAKVLLERRRRLASSICALC